MPIKKNKTTTNKISQSKVDATKVQPIEIVKGTIVEYDGGFMRVSRVTKNTVNLKAVFGKHVYHVGLDKSKVVEAEEAFYKSWRNSESYQSM